jgi:hypothetical protein
MRQLAVTGRHGKDGAPCVEERDEGEQKKDS